MKQKSCLVPFALFAISMLGGCSLAAPPKARSGILDLRDATGVTPLTGEWHVFAKGQSWYARVLLRAGFTTDANSSASSWALNVIVPVPGEYALVVPFPNETAAVFAGDKPLLEPRNKTSRAISPAILPFHAESSALIRVEIPEGGRSPGEASFLPAPYLLGTAKAMESFRAAMSALSGIKLGAFGGAVLVALMFALTCRRRKGFLALAGYMGSVVFFYLIKDASFLGFPLISSGTLDKLFLCALALRNLGLVVVALALFPGVIRGALPAIVLAPSVLLAAVPFIPGLPLGILNVATLGWGVLISVALVVYTGYRAARGDAWVLLFLIGQVVLLAVYAARWIVGDSLLIALILEPAGLGAFILLTTMTLVRKVGDVYREADSLSAYMDSMAITVKRFIPVEFMEYLQKSNITDLRLGDHVEKDMTIFFSDIRAFTQLSEDLTTEENFAFINSYLARMVPLIQEQGGFVDKYVGDGIMALFPDKLGADQALRTALEMQKRMVEYNQHRASVGYRAIEMGIGIHTGNLMLGVVGVQDRMENTVISDAVNLSSRLQAIAKAFDIGVVISEQSFKSLEDPGLFKYRFIGKVRVKGKAAPVSCFEIFDDTQDSAFELKMKANTFFEQGMLSYYQKEFVDSTYYFKRALEILPHDGAARFYLETCLRKAQ